jgi:hypothetical protein
MSSLAACGRASARLVHKNITVGQQEMPEGGGFRSAALRTDYQPPRLHELLRHDRARAPGGLDPPRDVAGGQQSRSSQECAARVSEPTMELPDSRRSRLDDKAPVAISLAFRDYLLPVSVDI